MKRWLLIFLFFSLFFSGCVSTQPPRDIIGPISKVFYTDYKNTWQALMLALENYPLAEEDKETGYVKTETIKGETLWQLPFHTNTVHGLRYSLYVQVVKGSAREKPATQVSITKKLLSRKGFIDSYHRVASNGLEEKFILYRILREININKMIVANRK